MNYLLFATELYALPILRPLAAAIAERGGKSAWCVPQPLLDHLLDDETALQTAAEAHAFAPNVVLVASNWVPDFLPGIKVQVFHGFNVQKRTNRRGHFRVRGLFDLYCTQGPATTAPFQALARRYQHFAVVETGWPKLDPLLRQSTRADGFLARDGRPVIAYAPTFTRALTSAHHLYDVIADAVQSGEWYWLLTAHPKSSPEVIARYAALAGENARFVEADVLMDMLAAADVLISDTSSVISEFVVSGKPVVTFRNCVPQPHMLDIQQPDQLLPTLRQALHPAPQLLEEIRRHAEFVHPTRDGRASERVLAAADALLAGQLGPLARKPINLWRRLQSRVRYRRWRETAQH